MCEYLGIQHKLGCAYVWLPIMNEYVWVMAGWLYKYVLISVAEPQLGVRLREMCLVWEMRLYVSLCSELQHVPTSVYVVPQLTTQEDEYLKLQLGSEAAPVLVWLSFSFGVGINLMRKYVPFPRNNSIWCARTYMHVHTLHAIHTLVQSKWPNEFYLEYFNAIRLALNLGWTWSWL